MGLTNRNNRGGSWGDMNSYSKRWECLFPQERFLMQELQ